MFIYSIIRLFTFCLSIGSFLFLSNKEGIKAEESSHPSKESSSKSESPTPAKPQEPPLSVESLNYPEENSEENNDLFVQNKTSSYLEPSLKNSSSGSINPSSPFLLKKESVFLVEDIPIELTPSLQTIDIRQMTLVEAQKQAFSLLFTRITGHETPPPLEPQELKKLVKSYEVRNEVITGRFYKAHYTISFFPEAVRTLLHSMNIPFAETYSKPILLIPVYRIDNKPISLFSQENTWLEQWQTAYQQSPNLLRLMLPTTETTGLLYEDIAEMRIANILQFMQKHEIEIAVISFASLYADTAQGHSYRLEIVDRLISTTGQTEALLPLSLESGVEPLEKLMKTAIKKSISRLDQAWKNHNLLKNKDIQYQNIEIEYTNLSQWLELKKCLERVSLIQGCRIIELAPHKLIIQVQHYGSIEHLKQAVQAYDLELSLKEKVWVLKKAPLHYLQETGITV